jgi:hypothetical protein
VTRIDVRCEPVGDGWRCSVAVRDGTGSTAHAVTIRAGDAVRLARDPDLVGVERLVTAVFEYLLEREPKESILSSFDLSVVGRYFPGFEHEVRARLGG